FKMLSYNLTAYIGTMSAALLNYTHEGTVGRYLKDAYAKAGFNIELGGKILPASAGTISVHCVIPSTDGGGMSTNQISINSKPYPFMV
ncbi:MAG TPA: hypothetical protein PK245_03980, partial [Clostridia bacterium]|nr:hypothetical protein [Clostridia bacterium]